MLDPVEVLDLKHCRKQDPMWAEKKARHYLEDAAACDILGPSHKAMAERYRARARILMGEGA
jgi:hypothetical protein